MTARYTSIGWNRNKLIYDGMMLGGIIVYFGAFIGVSTAILPSDQQLSAPILLIRAAGTCALIMLHIVLAVGPLARLDRRFLPLLYNRRHLGVTTFLIALLHALIVLVWYHGFGVIDPFVSTLISNQRYDSFIGFPFELFGVFALIILFVMAATSHDFWLKNLSPRTWKSVHMLVYFAYAALVLHVVLGALQLEKSPLLAALLVLGASGIGGLHLVAGMREVRQDAQPARHAGDDGWLVVCDDVSDIPEARARIVCPRHGERIAVFRNGNTLSAVSNVCEHQGGPLGEGKIIDGCITCPWHGYQYKPESGQSPPPYTETINTYQVRIDGRRVLVNPTPVGKGAPVEPAVISLEGTSRDA